MVRFESTLYFGNVERFRNMLVAITGKDPSIKQEPRVELAEIADSDENVKLIENEIGEDYRKNGGLVPNGVSCNLM